MKTSLYILNLVNMSTQIVRMTLCLRLFNDLLYANSNRPKPDLACTALT